MDVFDSRATQIHLDDELSFAYTPQELGLFKLVRDVVETLKEKLRSEREQRLPKVAVTTTKFSVGTAVEQLVSKLGADTEVAALVTLATLTPDEELELKTRRQSVAALQANLTDASLEVARSDREMFGKVQDCFTPFGVLDVTAHAAAQKKLVEVRAEHDQTTRLALAGENIPGVLGDAWKKFIAAGQEYIDADVPSHDLKSGD